MTPGPVRPRTVVNVALLATAIFAAPAVATVYGLPPDLHARSASGRYALDTVTLKEYPVCSLCELRDRTSGQVLWQRLVRRDQGLPTSVFVHDSTTAILWTKQRELQILAPVTGERVRTVPLGAEWANRGLAPGGRLVDPTKPLTRWSFLDVEDRAYFVIEGEGGRLIVDLASGMFVDDPALHAACVDDDRAFVLRTLESAARSRPRAHADELSPRDAHDTLVAVHLAGYLRLREAVSPLRELEASSELPEAVPWESLPQGAEFRPFAYDRSFLRLEVQRSLRRIGEAPSERSALWPRVQPRRGAHSVRARPPDLPAPRCDRVDLVQRGMTVREVLEAVGAPDAAAIADMYWKYYVYEATEGRAGPRASFTLRILWSSRDPNARVTEVSRTELSRGRESRE